MTGVIPVHVLPRASIAELRKRQFALAICSGMPPAVIAEALGLTEGTAKNYRFRAIRESGMADYVEFAVQQNAAVRERLYP